MSGAGAGAGVAAGSGSLESSSDLIKFVDVPRHPLEQDPFNPGSVGSYLRDRDLNMPFSRKALRNALTNAPKSKRGGRKSKAQQAHINWNQQDNNGLAPLHYAGLYGDEEAFRFLVKKGANPKLKTDATKHGGPAVSAFACVVMRGADTAVVSKSPLITDFIKSEGLHQVDGFDEGVSLFHYVCRHSPLLLTGVPGFLPGDIAPQRPTANGLHPLTLLLLSGNELQFTAMMKQFVGAQCCIEAFFTNIEHLAIPDKHKILDLFFRSCVRLLTKRQHAFLREKTHDHAKHTLLLRTLMGHEGVSKKVKQALEGGPGSHLSEEEKMALAQAVILSSDASQYRGSFNITIFEDFVVNHCSWDNLIATQNASLVCLKVSKSSALSSEILPALALWKRNGNLLMVLRALFQHSDAVSLGLPSTSEMALQGDIDGLSECELEDLYKPGPCGLSPFHISLLAEASESLEGILALCSDAETDAHIEALRVQKTVGGYSSVNILGCLIANKSDFAWFAMRLCILAKVCSWYSPVDHILDDLGTPLTLAQLSQPTVETWEKSLVAEELEDGSADGLDQLYCLLGLRLLSEDDLNGGYAEDDSTNLLHQLASYTVDTSDSPIEDALLHFRTAQLNGLWKAVLEANGDLLSQDSSGSFVIEIVAQSENPQISFELISHLKDIFDGLLVELQEKQLLIEEHQQTVKRGERYVKALEVKVRSLTDEVKCHSEKIKSLMREKGHIDDLLAEQQSVLEAQQKTLRNQQARLEQDERKPLEASGEIERLKAENSALKKALFEKDQRHAIAKKDAKAASKRALALTNEKLEKLKSRLEQLSEDKRVLQAQIMAGEAKSHLTVDSGVSVVSVASSGIEPPEKVLFLKQQLSTAYAKLAATKARNVELEDRIDANLIRYTGDLRQWTGIKRELRAQIAHLATQLESRRHGQAISPAQLLSLRNELACLKQHNHELKGSLRELATRESRACEIIGDCKHEAGYWKQQAQRLLTLNAALQAIQNEKGSGMAIPMPGGLSLAVCFNRFPDSYFELPPFDERPSSASAGRSLDKNTSPPLASLALRKLSKKPSGKASSAAAEPS